MPTAPSSLAARHLSLPPSDHTPFSAPPFSFPSASPLPMHHHSDQATTPDSPTPLSSLHAPFPLPPPPPPPPPPPTTTTTHPEQPLPIQPQPQPTPASSTSRPPTIVHGYTLHETLGTGTFGRVRRATKDGASYAIKIVSRQQLAASAMTPQLKREVAIQKSLRHPNIVELRQVLRSPNKLYMVLELAAEGELYWAIQRYGPLPLVAARRALFQLADAVVFCHHRGVCHRDIKPENILLDRNHNIKLTDFGLSSSSDPAHAHAYGGLQNLPDPRLLRTACGSPHYCAPEVRSPGKNGTYDGRKADAWSVGVVLFLMVNGYLPFHDEDPKVLQRLVESHPVVYPTTMPEQPRRICEKLLDRDPLRRWSLEVVLEHSWCKADPTLRRAIDSTPMFDMESYPPTSTAASGRLLSDPTGRWSDFDRAPIPDAPVPRVVPREAVPERTDTESFSERDDINPPPLALPEKPRRKSLMSLRALTRIRLASARDDERLSACPSDDGRDSSAGLKANIGTSSRSKQRKLLSALGSHNRENGARRYSHAEPPPQAETATSGRLNVKFTLPKVFGSLGGSRKPQSVPVPV